MGVLVRATGMASFVCAAALVLPTAALADPQLSAAACAPQRVSGSLRPAAALQSSVASPLGVLRRAAQTRRNDKADMTFTSRRTGDGAFQIEGRGGDLTLHKTVRQNGSFRLELETPRDQVTIAFANQSIDVARGNRTLTFIPQAATEEDLAAMQGLLAGSPAIRLSRVAASAVEASEDDSPEAIAVLLSDGFIGMLAGDPGAPSRVARHLTRHVRAGIRKVAVDCYGEYEQQVWNAWLDYEACLESIAVWDPIRWGCSLRYLVMAESYWFQFISCLGFSGVF